MVNYDSNEGLVEWLAGLVLAKKICPRMLVIFGNQCISIAFKDQFLKQLDKFDIAYLPDSIVEYAKKKNLAMQDPYHLTQESYEQYAKNLIIPAINSMDW